MPPITLMAAITLVVAAALWGGVIYVLTGRDKGYLWLLLPALPLSALVNWFVKRPLMLAVGQAAGIATGLGPVTPLWFIVFLWLAAPVTEEAIKVVPLALPRARRRLTGLSGALWTGMALGVGFGLGEALWIAYGIARSPAFAEYPWYAFTGYFGERLVVTFCHGVMTAVVVAGLLRGPGRAPAGYLAAVGLHAFLNAGAVLAQLGLISVTAAGLVVLVPAGLLAFIFERMRRAAAGDAASEARAAEVVYFRRGSDETDG